MQDNKAEKRSKHNSIIWQVAYLFIIGTLAIGAITYFSQQLLSFNNVSEQNLRIASESVEELTMAIEEYPAHEWMLSYWYRNYDDLDIEYDVDYGSGTKTEAKCKELQERYPDLQLKYATTKEVKAMSPKDQKLYAEITYSWLITRINQIKRSYQFSFLFCVLTKEPFDSQFFLFSAADEGAVRGTDYEEVYTLGVTSGVNESQQTAMMNATNNSSYFADAGDYVDYYAAIGEVDGHEVLIGITINQSDLRNTMQSQTIRGTVVAVIMQICLAVLCLIMILYFVINPLKEVQQSIRTYIRTKKSQSVVENLENIKAKNEIGQLSDDVVSLAEEMDDYLDQIEDITKEKERMLTELNLASRIQADMLPNTFPAFPERSEFDIHAAMHPAREVGGDFFDFFLIDDDHLCLVIADVSGKGIPASLFMMASKIILANNVKAGKSPSEVLTDTNNSICSNNKEEMFVTVWLGILELSTGKLTASNAGHEYPVIKDPDGLYKLYHDQHGFVIGGVEGIRYTEYEIQLEPGSKIFVYTDGIPEATNNEKGMFGLERMLQALNADAEAMPEQILQNMRSAVDEFVQDEEQFDDLTMLCLEYKGK